MAENRKTEKIKSKLARLYLKLYRKSKLNAGTDCRVQCDVYNDIVSAYTRASKDDFTNAIRGFSSVPLSDYDIKDIVIHVSNELEKEDPDHSNLAKDFSNIISGGVAEAAAQDNQVIQEPNNNTYQAVKL